MMHARPKPSFTPAVRTIVAVAVVSVVALCAVVVAREDLPAFRQGMWKFTRTVNGKVIESSKCTGAHRRHEVAERHPAESRLHVRPGPEVR